MRYTFYCDLEEPPLGEFNISAPMAEGPPRVVYCPWCGEVARRIYGVVPVKYNTQGFHTTDYDSQGDKLERLNKNWSKHYGEDPPPPAKDVPKNMSDPY